MTGYPKRNPKDATIEAAVAVAALLAIAAALAWVVFQ